VICCW